MNNSKLIGKKALVTGAGKRIGREIALALGHAGCDVLVHYYSSEKGAEQVVEELLKLGRKSFALKFDFKESNAPFLLASAVKEQFGSLDILINNASTFPSDQYLVSNHDLLTETPDGWDQALAINARTPFFLIQQLVPLLSKSPKAQIINLLDIPFASHLWSRAAYAISKSALKYISEFASQVLPANITVTGLELGPTLAPDQMSEVERERVNWVGVEKVVEEVLRICTNI